MSRLASFIRRITGRRLRWVFTKPCSGTFICEVDSFDARTALLIKWLFIGGWVVQEAPHRHMVWTIAAQQSVLQK